MFISGSVISTSKINIKGGQDGKEFMLLEDNYMDENELDKDGDDQVHSRPRNSHRKFNVYAKVEV